MIETARSRKSRRLYPLFQYSLGDAYLSPNKKAGSSLDTSLAYIFKTNSMRYIMVNSKSRKLKRALVSVGPCVMIYSTS